MAGQRDYSAEELDGELADLRLTLSRLGAAAEQELSADQFLELLRQRARQLDRADASNGSEDLAAAIRNRMLQG
jgi:hypothetical protein